MLTRARVTVPGLVLSLLLLPLFSNDGYAAKIELSNDVDIGWSNSRCFPALGFFACGSDIEVVGGWQKTSPDGLNIEIEFFTSHSELSLLNLYLDVADTSLEIIETLDLPAVLLDQDLSSYLADPGANPFPGSGEIIPSLLFHPSDFVRFENLDPAETYVFRLTGHIEGNGSYGACLTPGYLQTDDNSDGRPDEKCNDPGPASTPVGARITLSGGTNVQPATTVPEPGSFALSLLGAVGLAGLKRRRS